MSLLVLAVTVAMASVLLWAGVEKARRPGSIAATLQQLGLAERGARVVALCLAAAEIGVALGLIFQPASPTTLAGVLALATAFAVAGLFALRRHETIGCACFGLSGNGRLGKTQILALPVWGIGVAVLWLSRPAPFPDPALAALVPLTIATLRGVDAVREAHAARGDRRSAREMLLWLSR